MCWCADLLMWQSILCPLKPSSNVTGSTVVPKHHEVLPKLMLGNAPCTRLP